MNKFLIEKKKFPQTSTNSRQNSGEKQITRIMSLKHSKLNTPNSAGGNIKSNTYGIYGTGGTVNVNGGSITENKYGIFTLGGTINVNNTNISQNEYGIYSSSGTTNINGLTLAGNTHEIYGYRGTINIIDSNITSTTTSAIENEASAQINIISGNILSSAGSAIENMSTGTILIGQKDSAINKDTPIIQGETYGVRNVSNSGVKFYDGQIKGKNGAISGIYLELENGCKVATNNTDGYYVDTLKLGGTAQPIAYIGTVGYENLQSAINTCIGNEAKTIKLDNSTITTTVPFEIEEGQNIIIDLNGVTIKSTDAEHTIINHGTLTIIDSSTNNEKVGKILNENHIAIQNTGTLTIGTNDTFVSTTKPQITGKTNAIKTTGTLNFYDGIISANDPVDGTITNRPSGYIINRSTSGSTTTLTLGK